jgi:hypothetical protein
MEHDNDIRYRAAAQVLELRASPKTCRSHGDKVKPLEIDLEKKREESTAKLDVENYHAVAFAGRLRNGWIVSNRPVSALLQFLGLTTHFSTRTSRPM